MKTCPFLRSDLGVGRKPTHDEIACAAYYLYLEQGSEHGHDRDDWLRAEQLLLRLLNETDAPHSSLLAEGEEKNFSQILESDSPEQDGFVRWENIRRANIPYRPPSRWSPAGRREYGYLTSV